MKLSKYFTLEEMVYSKKALELGLDNTPSEAIIEKLKFTCSEMDKIRERLGYPITVSSGYRSLKVNKAVGSKAKNSQHLEGEAMDFVCPKFGTPRQIVQEIIKSGIVFDQLIQEPTWVHISFKKTGNRKQVLIIDKNGARPFK